MPETLDIEALLAAGERFIDLRSPGEFSSGAVPGAVNLPLLNDSERHEVGLTYKLAGQSAAIAAGEALVAGTVRKQRIDEWQAFASQHPGAWLYCWRGGLRSATAQRWLVARGLELPRVSGGFKALRNQCLAILERAPGEKPWYVLGGRTGTGKTAVLKRIAGAIDLEGLANHRGSAFGAATTPQPTPVTFENALAVAYLRHEAPFVLLEDESRTIGRLAIPRTWHAAMQREPLVILDAELDERACRITEEYVWQPLANGVAAVTVRESLLAALARIARRLGGQRTHEVRAALKRGFDNGDHQAWVRLLLEWYYDPMYDYQLDGKRDRIIFRGTAASVEAYLQALNDHVHEGAPRKP